MKKRPHGFLVAGCALFLLAAIFGSAAHDVAAGAPLGEARDSIEITHISPAAGTVLRGGDRVKLVVRVDYTLASARSARLAMIVQSRDRGPGAVIAERVKVVKAGERTTEFRANVRVPRGESLHVYVAVQPVGTPGTSTVDHLVYEVGPE